MSERERPRNEDSGRGPGPLGRLRQAAAGRLWPMPALGVTVAVLAGVALPRLEAEVTNSIPTSWRAYLFSGGATSAREVLGASAASLITVTSLTFSLTVLTLQLASGQFSPRLLRTFVRDRTVQVTLTLFLATFTYALAVLRTVRGGDGQQVEFVPQVSVTVAALLTLASVLGLVLFLAHLAREIRVESMLRAVHRDAVATVRRHTAEADDSTADDSTTAATSEELEPGRGAVLLIAERSGFLVEIDAEAVVAAARERDAVVVVDAPPGSSLIAGTPYGRAWPRAGAAFTEQDLDHLHRAMAGAVRTGFERTDAQDVGFALRQLVDVANKALSPGINDPTTAVHALSHVSALLCTLARRELGPARLTDERGEVRAVLTRPNLSDLLDVALTQPRLYGVRDPIVVARLFALLREVGWVVQRAQDRAAVRSQLARLRRAVEEQGFAGEERGHLEHLGQLVEDALGGEWSSEPYRASVAG
jgi:uncharacterized membrane protein